MSKKNLKSDSEKCLNKKNFQIDSRIKIVQKELIKLEESQKRQSSDFEAFQSITDRINIKRRELTSLKEAEKQIHNEQKDRKESKKAFIF